MTEYQFEEKPTRLKVKDNVGLYRDSKSNGIINTDEQAYKNYLKSKQINQGKDDRMKSLEDDVSSLKGDLKDIKLLLQEIAKNGTNK
jgi:hypothetical protein